MTPEPRTTTRARSLEWKLSVTAWVYIGSILVNLVASSGYLLFYFRPVFREAEQSLVEQQHLEQLRAALRRAQRPTEDIASAPASQPQLSPMQLCDALKTCSVPSSIADEWTSALEHLQYVCSHGAKPDDMRRGMRQLEGVLTKGIGNLGAARAEDLQVASSAHRRVLTVFIVNSAVGTLLCGLALYFVRRRLAQPVAQLKEATFRIRQGDFKPDIHIPFADEMGLLGTEISQMAGHVERLQNELVSRERQSAANEMVQHLETCTREPLAEISRLAGASARRNRNHRDVAECQDRITATIERFEEWLHAFHSGLSIDAGELVATELADLMSDVVVAVRPTLARLGVEIQVDLDAGCKRVRVDRLQFTQAVIALVTNAAEASSSGQSVRMSARPVELSTRSWELAVCDQGQGIAPDLLDRIFLPFFTTKQNGHGIGLSMVKAVAYRHGGELTVDTAPGRGTTFIIRLPAMNGPSAPAVQVAAQS